MTRWPPARPSAGCGTTSCATSPEATMHMSEVIYSRVLDVEGRSLGRVEDVRLVQDGPMLTNFGAALRVDGLFVGHSMIGLRLGFDRQHVKGPWPLKALFSRLERRGRFVPWDRVEAVDGGVVRLGVAAADLPTLGQAAVMD